MGDDIYAIIQKREDSESGTLYVYNQESTGCSFSFEKLCCNNSFILTFFA